MREMGIDFEEMGSVGELKNQGCGKVGEVRMKDETFFRSER